jgi:glycosyltransferase involved in cell wall biosynthesis
MTAGIPDAIDTVSVVVPTIGRARLADVVAAALRDPATTEVVVVADRDRRGVDALLDAAGLRGDGKVVVVDGDGRGPAAARQAGVARSRGDLVVLLDDDVVPGRGLVTAHRDAHVGRARLLVVGPMPVAAELRRSAAIAHVYANDYDAEWSELVVDPARVLYDLWAGNVSLRRADALAVPPVGELEDLRNREDQEWGLRAARAGIAGAIAPHAAAVHWHEGTAAGLLDAAVDQVRTGRALDARYPELGADADPGAGLPRAAHAFVELAGVPRLGLPLRRGTIAAARRFGDGPPSRWRVGLLVVARAIVQRAA